MNIKAPCGHLTSGSLYLVTIKTIEQDEEGPIRAIEHKYVCADCLARVKGSGNMLVSKYDEDIWLTGVNKHYNTTPLFPEVEVEKTRKETFVSKISHVIKGVFRS